MLHFDISEFDSPDEAGSAEKVMDSAFLQMIDDARGIAGVPFRITSGFRTPEHNSKVGGVLPDASKGIKGSSHMYGYAADISCKTGADRELILNALIRSGFRRIGVGSTFLHCDNDPDKYPSIWLYS